MSNTAFSTKKIQTKKSSLLKKTIIGSTLVALISALGFGVYQASDTSGGTTRGRHKPLQFAHSQVNTVPAFASKASKSTIHKRQNSLLHKKKSTHHSVSKHKKSKMKLAGHKKRGKIAKADLSKLSKHHKKHLAKGKKAKRSAKNLASK